jgi:nitrogen fixation/metabolism regulation signal transduction histidine kinase
MMLFFVVTLIPLAIINKIIVTAISSFVIQQSLVMVLSLMVLLPLQLLFIYSIFKSLQEAKAGTAISAEAVAGSTLWLKGLAIFGIVAGILAFIIAFVLAAFLASWLGSSVSSDLRQQIQTGLQTNNQQAVQVAIQQALNQAANKTGAVVSTSTNIFPNCAVEQIACPAGQGSLIYSLSVGQCGRAYCVPTKCANNIKGGVLNYLVCIPSADPTQCPKCSVVSGR